MGSNKDKAIIRLLREAFGGVELFIKILFKKYDFFLFSSPNFLTAFIGALACVLTRRKFILDIRDIYPHVFFYSGLIKENSLPAKILMSFTNFIYNRASFISVVTDGLREIVQNNTQTEVVVVRNGYSHTSEKVQVKKSAFKCLFHGTFGVFQDIDSLKLVIERVFQLDPSIEFHLYGDGPKISLLDQIESKSCTLYGHTDHTTLQEVIPSHDIGLSFRVENEISRDAFPVKVYEYIGANIPIISTPKNCDVASFIHKFSIGYNFDNNETEKISQMILDLKNNQAKVNSIKENIQKSKDQFSRVSQAQKLLKKLNSKL